MFASVGSAQLRRPRSLAAQSRSAKRVMAIVLDLTIVLFTVWFSFYLRLGSWITPGSSQVSAFLAALGALPIFWFLGIYRSISRFSGFDALIGIARACFVYGLIYAGVFTFAGVDGVPRTIGLIQPILLLMGIAGTRALARYFFGLHLSGHKQTQVLVYGAGSSGRQLAAAIAGGNEMRVRGFVDDDPSLHGSVLNGQKIYRPSDLDQIVNRLSITDILLAVPSATRKRRAEIIDSLRHLGVKIRTLPGFMDVASGKFQVDSLKPLDIEDLLGRDTAFSNNVLFSKNILDKTVLVTGAGGSIGSELCRQIVAASPKVLLLVERSEFGLYSIDNELRALLGPQSPVRIVPLLGSVLDVGRMQSIFSTWQPQTVYHAAAYKHVPLVEHNPIEGVSNNVFGTVIVARTAIANGVDDFVLVSTDKAVRPTNVMGTSKRLAELALQALAAESNTTRLSMVRFGNVLGSSGSVVPLFRTQIEAGGPVTITHAEVTRYFMTIPEAAQLVIQAGAMASGGEVFVLDMGEPVRIADLARKMIELSGLAVRDADDPDGEIEIDVIGLRPGEKLYEELLIGENPVATSHPLIMKARESCLPQSKLAPLLDQLEQALYAHDVTLVSSLLRVIVPEFAPSSDIVDWVHMENISGIAIPARA